MSETVNVVIAGTPTPIVLFDGNTQEAANQAAVALGAAELAQSAAAAALSAAGVGEYADTSAGLADTAEGETFWVDQGDGTGQVYRHDAGPVATALQSFIIDPSASGAAGIIGTPRGDVQSAINGIANLRESAYGADANNNPGVWAAAMAAKDDGFEVLRLPYVPGEANIAYFETFTPADLVGITLDIDPRITLSLPSNEPLSDANAKLIRFVNPPTFHARSLSVDYAASKEGGDLANDNGARRVMPYIRPNDIDRSVTRRVLASTLTPLTCGWPSDDSWEADSFSDSSLNSFVLSPADDDSFHMGFGKCKPGDEFSLSFAIGGTAADLVALVRHSGGFAGVLAAGTYSSTVKAITKLTGVTGVQSDIGLVGPGTHETYSGLGSVWTIRIDSWTHFTILWNGTKVRAYETPGIIQDCGFGARPNAGSQVIACQNQVRRFGAPTYAGQFISIRSYGDSTLQARYDDCPTFLKDSLDLTCGIRNWKFVNRAVGGDGIAQQLALMQSDNSGGTLAEANVVMLQVGVNDIQGLTDLTQFRTDFEDAIQLAHSVGATVVIGIPPLFYTQGQAGPIGQATANYGRGAPYRSTIMDLVAQYDRTPSNINGPRCIMVDLPALDGPVVANYANGALTPDMTGSGDPVAYDNIHPTTETNKRRADAYARAIASFAAPYSGSLYLPPTSFELGFLNGWEQMLDGESEPIPNVATITAAADVEAYLYVAAGGSVTRTDGTQAFQLPRPFWPLYQVSLNAFAGDPSDNLRVTIDTIGRGFIYGAVASTYFAIRPLRFNIEDREVL